MYRSRKFFLALASAGALLAATVAVFVPLHAASAGVAGTVINVDTTDDENNDDGDCSLREAVESANTNTAVDDCEPGTAADTVMIPAGAYTFAADGDGAIRVFSDVMFKGAGASTTIVDADGVDGVFDVGTEGDLTVEFDGLTITGGDVDGSGGGIGADSTALTVRNSIVTGNSATRDGGGIDSDDSSSSLTLINSTVSNNTAGDEGGGFRQDNSTTSVTVVNSTISGNTAVLGGGIHIDNDSIVSITGSTISDNTALESSEVEDASFQGFRSAPAGQGPPPVCGSGGGGGGYNQDSSSGEKGSTTIANSTITGNTSECAGGGLFVATDATLTNVTVFDNGAPLGGNVFSDAEDPREVNFVNTIVAAPRSGEDCASTASDFVSSGGNIDTDGSCNLDDPSDQTVDDVMLGALAENGGSTKTHLPLAGSPAIDLALDANCPDDDQRGIARPQDGDDDGTSTCDVGAVEVVFTPEPTTTTTAAPEVDVDADTATPATPTVASPTFTG